MKYTLDELWDAYQLQEDENIPYINKGDRVLINDIETLLDSDHECTCIDVLKKASCMYTVVKVEKIAADLWAYTLNDGTVLFDSDIKFVFKEE